MSYSATYLSQCADTLCSILNNCIYRAWFPGDCQDTLTQLTNMLNDGSFQQKINVALWHVADSGRTAGGAQPIQSFQVYVTSYMQFFNQVNTECDSISWNYYPWYSTPKLDVALRTQLNGLVLRVNTAIQAAAHELANMGVIYFDGLDDSYQNHRFCEPQHTSNNDGRMIDYDTWFWSPYAPQHTTSEGPGDPSDSTTESAWANDTQLLLDFVFPDKTVTADSFSASNLPWNQPEASKYPDLDSLLTAMMDDGNATIQAVPFNYQRSFHPKGTPYGVHASLFFSNIADNRDTVAAQKASSSATSPTATATASATASIVPQANPSCDDSLGVNTEDADDARQYLVSLGNGASDNNCCTIGTIPCEQIAINGTAAVDLCGNTTKQCAGCSNIATALKDIIVDCTNNYKVGGKVAIPYLNGVTLELSLNDST